MELLPGTSGFSYDAWKGVFYPAELRAADRLAYYAERLPAVEVNNTFYRMPRGEVLAGWARAVPPGFRFAVKASRRITHHGRLAGVEDAVLHLGKVVGELGAHLGPILFQLPPTLRKDVERLKAFLGGLPGGLRAALEFRHPSWGDEEVHAALRDHGACLVHCDEEEAGEELVPTTDWGYLRLRRQDYGDEELEAWLRRIREQPWERAYCFFKHEEAGAGPRLARRLAELHGPAPSP